MTQTTFPITGEPFSNAQWGDVVSELATPGVVAAVGGPGLLPYRTGAGLFVPAGEALTTQGALYRNTADVQVTVTSNGGGSPRNDLLVLRHDFAVAPEAQLVNIAGGAVGPTHTVATDVPLGRPVVPTGSVIPSSVTDARTFTSIPVVPCRTVADIPAAVRRFGMVAVELASTPAGRMRVWTGAVWDRVVTASEYGGTRFYHNDRGSINVSDNYTAGSFVTLMSGSQELRPGSWVLNVDLILSVTGAGSSIGYLRVMFGATNQSQDHRLDTTTIATKTAGRYYREIVTQTTMAWSVAHQVATGTGVVTNEGCQAVWEYLGPLA